MRVGVILPLGEESQPGVPRSFADIRSLATRAEDAGLDSVWVYDHLLGESTEDAAASPWEAWTVMSALAGVTSRVRLGALVLCTAFRPPGVLARMADTLQEISDGRVVLGLGAGWHEPEFTAFGLAYDHRVGRFAEALEIVTTMLRAGRATVPGRYQEVEDAPVRIRPGRAAPEVLVAGIRPRMLRLTAEYADSWNLAWFGVPGDRFREANHAVTAACEEIGRDPATLARTAGIRIDAPGHPAVESSTDTHDPQRVIRGDANEIAQAFAAWEAEGVSELICWPEPSDVASVDLIADALARHRG
ncbi:MAG: LLM class flavin-dependent oxidoreductase [Actinopolymorphaceae bacterium]